MATSLIHKSSWMMGAYPIVRRHLLQHMQEGPFCKCVYSDDDETERGDVLGVHIAPGPYDHYFVDIETMRSLPVFDGSLTNLPILRTSLPISHFEARPGDRQWLEEFLLNKKIRWQYVHTAHVYHERFWMGAHVVLSPREHFFLDCQFLDDLPEETDLPSPYSMVQTSLPKVCDPIEDHLSSNPLLKRRPDAIRPSKLFIPPNANPFADID